MKDPGAARGSDGSRGWHIACRIAIAAVVVGVFCTWIADNGATLNGTEGPNNGWLCVLLAGPAYLWTRRMERGAWTGVAGVLGCAVVIGWTAVENWRDGRDVLSATVSYGLLIVLAASLLLLAAAVARGVSLAREARSA